VGNSGAFETPRRTIFRLYLECGSVRALALAKELVIVGGSASRFSESTIWVIASLSATPGARLNEIVTAGS
jgi:hypothetical protein